MARIPGSIGRALSGALITACVGLGAAGVADASHYRGANASWEQIGTSEAEISLVTSWRRSWTAGTAPDGFVAIGDPWDLDWRYFGDSASEPNHSEIIAINTAEDFLIGRSVATDGSALRHTYDAPGPWPFRLSSCCTISTLNNSPDSNFVNTLAIDFSKASRSPRTSVPPIVDVGASGVQTFAIPALGLAAPCNTLRWRVTDPMASLHTNPPGFAINSSTGVVSWDTTGLGLGLYIAGVTIEAIDAGGGVCSAIEAQFLLRVTDNPNQAPDWIAPTPADQAEITVAAGSPLDVDLAASDADAPDTVHIDHIGLPTGATLGQSDGNPASASFEWTPSAAQVGDHLVTFTAQDSRVPPASALPRTIVVHVVRAKKDTALVAHPAVAQALPGLKVNLKPSATLTSGGAPVAGKKIAFATSKGAAVCTGTTNAAGTASCSGIVPLVQVTLSLGYKAAFAGDDEYKSSADIGQLVKVAGIGI